MAPPPAAASLLDAAAFTDSPRLAILRDDTDASDAIPLLLQLVTTLGAPASRAPPSPVVLLTTRTRATFSARSPHAYPHLTRGARALASRCVALDPHDIGVGVGAMASGAPSLRALVRATLREVRKHGARIVAVECAQTLQLAFGVHAAAFVRALLAGPGRAVSVVAVLPVSPSGDDDDDDDDDFVQAGLSSLAHDVIELRDLQTGAAPDIDGTVAVSKRGGHWLVSPSARRYKVSDTSFTIYT